MGSSLTGQKINQTYDALLKVSDNGALDGTLQTITDGLGNDSALSLSTAGASVGGTLAVSGNATLSSTLGVTGAATLSSTLAVTGNLTVDTNTLFVDSTNNWVAVGATSINSARFGVVTSSGTSTLKVHAQHNSSPIASLELQRGSGDAWGADAYGDYKINNGDGGNLIFDYGESGTTTERMRIHSGGDISFRDSSANEAFYWDASAASLGIGTNSPNAKTNIENGHLLVSQSANTTQENILLQGAGYHIGSTLYGNVSIRSNYNHLENSGTLNFYTAASGTNTTERMRIDSSGNVGIGTGTITGYSNKILHIAGTDGAELHITTNGSGGLQSDGLSIGLRDSDGSVQISQRDNSFMAFATNDTERMRITSGGYLKASDNGTYLAASSTYHELKSSVNSAIAVVSSTAGSPNGISLQFLSASPNNSANVFFECYDSTESKFIVYSNGNAVNRNNSYGAISDAKLKENVVDASPKLDDLMQVQVRNFNYIGDDKKQLGVVAQELEQVFPSMIDESPDYEEVEVPQLDHNGQEVLDENGEVVMTKERVDLGTVTKSVKYSVFVPMLIKAIQELNAKVESLEAQLNA